MELELIMELQREERLSVFPVFYGVKPSSVRHQQGSFDLERYQRDPEMADKVLKWREALKLIAGLSGVESKLCIDEATMVEKIAQDISRSKTFMHNIVIDSRHVVGEETHMQGLKSLLDMDSSNNDEVRMIGIWGMGGIGKTTIAKCLYGQLSLQFSATHFTQDLKGIHTDTDLIKVQKELLRSTLKETIRPWSVEAGSEVIAARLRNHKVLLVLDGVKKMSQVHALAKATSWFGPQSRIIITTRDRGLLSSCGVKIIYEVNCLDDEDSLQMFKDIAFEGGRLPSDDFEELSIRAARLAHGLPSALRAYALFLRGRDNSPEEWEEALCGLESATKENIMKILKLSYWGLAEQHKKVFLYIVCFFNGETCQRIGALVHGYLEIKILAEKSLINITTNGYVILHKLIEQMGREIMLKCCEFLGDPKRILYDLQSDYGTGTVLTECISLHTCEMTCAFPMKTSLLNRMCYLKFLKVYKHVDDRESRLQVLADDHNLSLPQLRLFHWDAFPLSTFPLKGVYSLVELILRHSNLETLWSGTPVTLPVIMTMYYCFCYSNVRNPNYSFPQVLNNLKKLDVTGSKNLKRLPKLSCVKNLEELILEECTRLKDIPESIGHKSTLRRINLSDNGGPKSPMLVVIRKVSGTQRITLRFLTEKVEMELVNISIAGDIKFRFSSGCEGYADYFSFSSEHHIPVQQPPRLISEFNKFEALNIRRFSYKENGLPVAFHSFPDLLALKELKLINLNIHILSDGIGDLEFLEKLDLSGNDFENLPEAMSKLYRLKTLWLRNCRKLKELPELAQVQSLTLSNCRNLRSLVKPSDSGRYCLLELCLDNCKNVESLSDQLIHFTKLTYLDLSSHDFETLPSSIREFTSLVTLCLYNCKKLKSVGVLPQSLQFLYAQGCDSLEADALEHFNERRNVKKIMSSSVSQDPLNIDESTNVDDKAPLWIYVKKIKKLVGGGSWRFECKFCSNIYVGSHSKVATHLLQEGIKGIKGCAKVKPHERAQMKKLVDDCKERIKHAAPKAVSLPSSSKNISSSFLDYDMSYRVLNASGFDPKKRKGTGPLEKSFQNEAREQCDGEIARMFYTGGLSFNLARNPHYRNSYVRASQIPGYVPPGYNALRTTLLQKERKNIDLHLQPLKNTWKQKGVSICSDGWSDPQRRPIFNLIAANESGPMLLRAVNTHGETKTGEMIAEMIIECIKEVGHENVVQVVTDNAPNCVKAGALISAKFPTIFWTPCVVHTLNLAMKNICAPLLSTRSNEEVYEACYWIKSISEDVSWIKKFIINHGMRLVMFSEHCDLKLLTIASTRFASTVVMLKRFKKIKTVLQQMVISPKWDDYKEDSVERASAVKKKILDEMFWDELEYVLSFTLPIYSVIRAADTDRPSLHLVHEWWESMIQNVKKAIFKKERKQLNEDSAFWNAVHSVLTSRWSKSNTSLHCMAHSLNPKYYSSEWLAEEDNRKAPHQDLEVTRERKTCILKYFPNQDERREVNVEYSNFSLCMEDFGSVDAIHDRFILEPLRWWAVHGSSAPKLQALAFKLLGQPSSSSCCERNWSTYKFIHSAVRNKIVPQRAEDLVFVHTNLRLLSRKSYAYKEGPHCMWDVGGDQFDSLDEINLGRLEFEDLSLDEPELEAVVFDDGNESEDNDDMIM